MNDACPWPSRESFALIAETHRDGRSGALYALPMWLIRAVHLSDVEHGNLLVQAGFTEVTLLHAPGKSWICATGRTPVPDPNAPRAST